MTAAEPRACMRVMSVVVHFAHQRVGMTFPDEMSRGEAVGCTLCGRSRSRVQCVAQLGCISVHAPPWVDTRVGVRAGQLLGAARKGSELGVDAFVVAVADLAGGATIATVEVEDLELLASYADNVVVALIQA